MWDTTSSHMDSDQIREQSSIMELVNRTIQVSRTFGYCELATSLVADNIKKSIH